MRSLALPPSQICHAGWAAWDSRADQNRNFATTSLDAQGILWWWAFQDSGAVAGGGEGRSEGPRSAPIAVLFGQRCAKRAGSGAFFEDTVRRGALSVELHMASK